MPFSKVALFIKGDEESCFNIGVITVFNGLLSMCSLCLWHDRAAKKQGILERLESVHLRHPKSR